MSLTYEQLEVPGVRSRKSARRTCKDGQVVDVPLPTFTAGGNHVAEVRAFLIKYYGCGDGQTIKEPLHTVTTKDRLGLVEMFFSGFSEEAIAGAARVYTMLREHLGEDAPLPIVIIKGAVYLIVDLGMRMLTPRELASAHDFPADYILTGTKTNQVARIGNSVVVSMAEAIVRANFKIRRVAVQAARAEVEVA